MPDTTALIPLFGDPNVVVIDAPQPSITGMDRAAEWSRAYNQWLDELRAENTRRAYERAWRDLLNYTGKFPWAIQSQDIRDWMQDLAERPLTPRNAKGLIKKGRRDDRFGYSPATIAQWLAAVSSFFTFTMQKYLVIDREGRERPLHDGINPARAVRRPKINAVGKATYLEPQDLFLLLKAIPQNSIQGLRDYALILGYILTGRRNSEWRILRWGDFDKKGNRIFYYWSGKGKTNERYELPPPVWTAIIAYLKADDRLDIMAEGDYIFRPTNDNATRLDNISELTWDRNRPLSTGHTNNLLKKYARRADLDGKRIHIHILRHSAAMLREAAGDDIQTICKFLNHSTPNITIIYLDHMKGAEDTSWRKATALLKLDLIGTQKQGT